MGAQRNVPRLVWTIYGVVLCGGCISGGCISVQDGYMR